MKLTDKLIASLSPERKVYLAWDSEVKGFGVRIYPGGKKSWVYVETRGKRRAWRTIGDAAQVSVEWARAEAKIFSQQPSNGKRRLKFSELARQWVEIKGKKNKTFEKTKRRLERSILPVLGSYWLEDITPALLSQVHNNWSEAPYEANRKLEIVSVILNFAVSLDLLAKSPAQHVTKNREHPRMRYVTPAEMPRLLQSIEQEREAATRAALKLILFTGCRKEEILSLTWSQVDVGEGTFTLFDTKNGKPTTCAIPSLILTEILSLPRPQGSDWVFPSPQGGRLKRVQNAWTRIRNRAGVQDVTIHDLRRTVASWLLNAGYDLGEIGKLLNHTSPQTTARYASLAVSRKRVLVEAFTSSSQLTPQSRRGVS